MPKFHLVVLIHSHQPVGNFDNVFEQTYQRSYLPFVECLMRHPGVRLGLHYSGALLEWCEKRHPEFLEHLRELAARRQVELIGGGFYEPILVSIPREDQAEQLQRMREYIRGVFGSAPTGAWLAERVWEPQLPDVLSSSEVQYTLVDDVHFLSAGFELDQLHGDYVAEDSGRTVRVFPGLKELRYLLPFRPVEDAMSFLRECAMRHPGGMAATGDDCEKFGAWPNTFDHCYRDGWVDRFFAAVEAASDWLALTPPGEYVSTHTPLGRADLPTASYSEMMEWVLPTAARTRFHALNQEFAGRPDVLRFLRGGQWRGFFAKYSESNLLHKKMLHVSRQVRELSSRRFRKAKREQLEAARTHVLRAQCNDTYWHGVFGGVYAPHLRTEPWRELVRAEAILHEIAPGGPSGDGPDANGVHRERMDYDADGVDEVYVTSRRMAALVRPADGGTIASIDFRGTGVTLINSLMRRVEAYHARLREASSGIGQQPGAVLSIHDQVLAKEAGLERFLQYDRWPRNAFRLLLFGSDKTFAEYQALQLDENAVLAAGGYTLQEGGPQEVHLACETPLIRCLKTFSFGEEGEGFRIDCDIELVFADAGARPAQVGVEMVINLLAPDAEDRYFETATEKHPLRWAAAARAADFPEGCLRMADEWQNVAVTIEARGAKEFWVDPIETVSESEEGFERVYQGSQILAVWPGDFEDEAGREDADGVWRGRLTLRVSAAH